jgi:Transglycosylase SLT domain
MRSGALLAVVPLAAVTLLGAAFSTDAEQAAGSTIASSALPPLARRLLPEVESIRVQACPQLPLVWVIAEVQAESAWDPRAYSSAGAAGLLQMTPAAWLEATGRGGWASPTGPPDGDPVWQPIAHLRAAIPWMCGHLRVMADHLRRTGKPTAPLDAMAVCHIAGCGRVTGSATGIPAAGEAGCDTGCSSEVHAYLTAIHNWVVRYSRPVPVLVGASPAQPYAGHGSGCTVPDPTGTGGCLTSTTVWMLAQAESAFPGTPASCWDAHAWNPSSDHPLGMACDFGIGRAGTFPGPDATARGWALATWARENAIGLHITYVIWQGRIWSASRADEGWRPYTGGGLYDPNDPTGGHYDHIHISTAD